MAAKAIMLQGTSSNVGKSLITTGLCRVFLQDGFRVAPFKSQNMSLNSYVTRDGLEIGRAQGIQAEASGVEATVDMNPILLKPSSECRAQVVVLGKPVGHMGALEYREHYVPTALEIVGESLRQLCSIFDLIVLEGAGSPAEVNLKDRDIANMRVAHLANAPVLLVGDVDRGGVFASLIGTLDLLEPAERDRVRGFILNKFRGDLDLLKPGLEFLEQKTGVRVLGVLPFLHDHGIDEEDSVCLNERGPLGSEPGDVRVAVLRLPFISNFTDFKPLEKEPGVSLHYVGEGRPLGTSDLLVIPGTKSTVADLEHLRSLGYDREIARVAAGGTLVMGICGGYQMLGRAIRDDFAVESRQPVTRGLGLLDVVTTFSPEKTTQRVRGEVLPQEGPLGLAAGVGVGGYEIHMGVTERGNASPFLRIREKGGKSVDNTDGGVNPQGNVFGTYLHGIFDEPDFRSSILNMLRIRKGLARRDLPGGGALGREEAYNRLADTIRRNLDLNALYQIMGVKRKGR